MNAEKIKELERKHAELVRERAELVAVARDAQAKLTRLNHERNLVGAQLKSAARAEQKTEGQNIVDAWWEIPGAWGKKENLVVMIDSAIAAAYERAAMVVIDPVNLGYTRVGLAAFIRDLAERRKGMS